MESTMVWRCRARRSASRVGCGPRPPMPSAFRLLASCVVLVGCSDVLGLGGLEYDLVDDSDGGSTGGAAGNTAGTTGGGAAGATGGTGALGGASGLGQDAAAAAAFSDEFNDSSTLPSWTLRHQVEMESPLYTALDIDQTSAGQLVIEPTLGAVWHDASAGPFFFKPWSGNFLVTARVSAVNVGDGTSPPTGSWVGVGILMRDPASAAGDESWVLLTNGLRNNSSQTGTSYWSTTGSSTVLIGHRSGPHHLLLGMCRLDGAITLYWRFDTEMRWTEITTIFEGSTAPQLPDTVQLGIAAHIFDAPSADLRAEVDFIRLTVPTIPEQCMPAD